MSGSWWLWIQNNLGKCQFSHFVCLVLDGLLPVQQWGHMPSRETKASCFFSLFYKPKQCAPPLPSFHSRDLSEAPGGIQEKGEHEGIAAKWRVNLASEVVLVVKNPPVSAGDMRDVGSIPGSGRSPGGGNGYPLQYSCLENPMNRGAWWATVHRVTKSQTQIKWLSMHKELTHRAPTVMRTNHHTYQPGPS